MTIKSIELKNVKFAEFASQETNCFSATVYVNGVRTFETGNEGCGGPDNVHILNTELYAELEDYAKSLPSSKFEYGGKVHEIKQDPDSIVGDLFDKWLEAKEYKRLTSNGKRTAFQIATEPNTYRTVLAPFTETVRLFIHKKYPNVTSILNDTPMPQPMLRFE